MTQLIINTLRAEGYAVQENILNPRDCEKMAEALDGFEQGHRGGPDMSCSESQVTIFNAHLLLPDLFLNKIDLSPVMDVVGQVLKDSFILSNFNASRSGSAGGVRVHIDSRVPMVDFENTLQIVAMLCLDDFRSDNGATRIWPKSHLSGIDPRSQRGKEIPGWISPEAKKGSVIYVLGQTWHDIGANSVNQRRWGIIAYYSRWWIKPTFDFTRCGENIYNRLTERQKSLLGFNSRPPLPHQKRVTTLTSVSELPQNYEEALRTL